MNTGVPGASFSCIVSIYPISNKIQVGNATEVLCMVMALGKARLYGCSKLDKQTFYFLSEWSVTCSIISVFPFLTSHHNEAETCGRQGNQDGT